MYAIKQYGESFTENVTGSYPSRNYCAAILHLLGYVPSPRTAAVLEHFEIPQTKARAQIFELRPSRIEVTSASMLIVDNWVRSLDTDKQ